tara:strand:+ start:7942 stop:8160 length:219 start_codon:yes stop_codon:yes gene_type:complete
MGNNNKQSKKENYILITGIILIASCCFGPILIGIVGGLTLSAFTPYFKYALIIAVLILIVIGWRTYKKIKKK